MRDSVASMSNSPIECLRRNAVECEEGIIGGVAGGVGSLPRKLRAVFFLAPDTEIMDTSALLASVRSSNGALHIAPMAPRRAQGNEGLRVREEDRGVLPRFAVDDALITVSPRGYLAAPFR